MAKTRRWSNTASRNPDQANGSEIRLLVPSAGRSIVLQELQLLERHRKFDSEGEHILYISLPEADIILRLVSESHGPTNL